LKLVLLDMFIKIGFEEVDGWGGRVEEVEKPMALGM
jgi:hypothetical protein